MNAATLQKRADLANFITTVLAPQPEVQGVIALGSLTAGQARPESDIDAVVFFDPFDLYVVPAEFLWHPVRGTFHSIFVEDEVLQQDGIQFDFTRLDLRQWADPGFEWPESRKAELTEGWIAFDRTGNVEALIQQRTVYPEELRLQRLDEAITWLDQHLSDDGPEVRWDSLGPAMAHDRLHAAYGYLVQALFAYNRRWQPWRNREMSYLLTLPWLPENFAERILTALNAPSHDYDGYMARANSLRSLFAEILARLIVDGEYEDDAIGQAFIRSHEEPGRAWNMAEWNQHHGQRAEHNEKEVGPCS